MTPIFKALVTMYVLPCYQIVCTFGLSGILIWGISAIIPAACCYITQTCETAYTWPGYKKFFGRGYHELVVVQ